MRSSTGQSTRRVRMSRHLSLKNAKSLLWLARSARRLRKWGSGLVELLGEIMGSCGGVVVQ